MYNTLIEFPTRALKALDKYPVNSYSESRFQAEFFGVMLMSDQLTRIEENLSKLVEVVSAHAVTLGRMDERVGFLGTQLQSHMKETKSNEDAIIAHEKAMSKRLKPIEAHVSKVKAVLKAAVWACGLLITAALSAAVKIFSE